jgi:hypothetical protein
MNKDNWEAKDRNSLPGRVREFCIRNWGGGGAGEL